MHTTGIIALICVTVLVGIPCFWLIAANTKALNTEKALRRTLAQIQSDFDALDPGISEDDPEMQQILRRIHDYDQEFQQWRRSPFVITR